MTLIIFIAFLFSLMVGCAPLPPPPTVTPVSTATPLAEDTPEPTARATLAQRATLTPSPTVATTPTPDATIIEVWAGLPSPQQQALEADVQAFEAEFPQYQVSLQPYSDPEALMLPLRAGDIEVDVALVFPLLLTNMQRQRDIAPMDEFFPPSFIDGFAAPTLVGATAEDQLWGLADTTGFHLLLFYNRDLVDTPPATFNDLFDLAEEDAAVLALNSEDPLWLLPLLTAHGGTLTDEEGEPTLDTEPMIAALTEYAAWHEAGLVRRTTYDEARQAFLNGDVPFLIDGEWTINELTQAGQLNWGVAPLPALTVDGEAQTAAPLILGRYWVISSSLSGDRALAASTFLEFVTRPERQLDWSREFGLLPTRRTALDDSVILNNPTLRVSSEQMLAGEPVSLDVDVNGLISSMRGPLRDLLDDEFSPQVVAAAMQVNAE